VTIGIPRTIADLGIVKAQLGQVAEQALGSARLIKNNLRPIDLESMAQLVEAASPATGRAFAPPRRSRRR